MIKKHIAIIDHVGQKAGMDSYSGSLARGFLQCGYKASVYSNFVGPDPDCINYHELYEGHSSANKLVKLFRLLTATIKASSNAKKQQVGLVIIHLFAADLITILLTVIPKLFGLKVAVISHDVSSFTDNDKPWIQNQIYNRMSDFIIVHNEFSHKALLENVNISDPEKVVTIKQGGYLDDIHERPDKKILRKELGLDENGKYILFFGQIKKVKGLDILLSALAHTSEDIKLIIAGKPWKDDFSNYDKLLQEHGLQKRVVKIIRFIENDEREKLFFAADVNVLPYRVIYQSAVLLMAMSHGLPVIASDLPPNKEVIEDGDNGILFKTEDSNDLAKKIDQFFLEQSIQKEISHQALETIRNEYSWSGIAQKYINMIEGN